MARALDHRGGRARASAGLAAPRAARRGGAQFWAVWSCAALSSAALGLAQPRGAAAQDAGTPAVSVPVSGPVGEPIAEPIAEPIIETPVVRAPPMLAVGAGAVAAAVRATADAPDRALATGTGRAGAGAPRVPRLTAGELAQAINERAPALRAAYVDRLRVEELASALVRERVLAEAARRGGLLEDPGVQREFDRVLTRALLERARAADPAPPVDETMARAFYDAHLEDYTKPAQVRVLAIVLATRSEAQRVLADVARVRETRFAATARRRSIDGPSRRRGGSLGWIAQGSRAESTLVDAALALRLGETAAAPIEVEGRFYVLRAVDRRAPELVPFERARASITSRLRAEHERRVADVLLARAAREQELRVEEAAESVHIGP